MYHSNACRTKSPTTRIAGGRWFSPLALFRIFLSKKGKFLQSRCFKKEFEQRQMGECIQDKIRLLPESYQTVLILYDLMEFSHQEIAEVVDISVEMGANLIDAGGLWIEIKFFSYFLQFVCMRQQNNHHQSWLRQIRYSSQWLIDQVVIKTNRLVVADLKWRF